MTHSHRNIQLKKHLNTENDDIRRSKWKLIHHTMRKESMKLWQQSCRLTWTADAGCSKDVLHDPAGKNSYPKNEMAYTVTISRRIVLPSLWTAGIKGGTGDSGKEMGKSWIEDFGFWCTPQRLIKLVVESLCSTWYKDKIQKHTHTHAWTNTHTHTCTDLPHPRYFHPSADIEGYRCDASGRTTCV